MSNVLVEESSLQDIADSIRAKNLSQTKYKPREMAAAIDAISSGGITPTGTKEITENGTYDVAQYASAEVSVPTSGTTPTGTKQISIAQNGTTTEDVANYASAEITVNVQNGGSSMVSGSFTPDSNSKTFSVTVPSGITNFVFYATDFNEGIADAGWITVGGVWFNSVGSSFMRYNQANSSSGSLTVSLNGTTLSGTAQYTLRTEKTYVWYAW